MRACFEQLLSEFSKRCGASSVLRRKGTCQSLCNGREWPVQGMVTMGGGKSKAMLSAQRDRLAGGRTTWPTSSGFYGIICLFLYIGSYKVLGAVTLNVKAII